MKEKAVIALDLGTTGNRAIAFNGKGSIICESYYEFPQIYPKPAWVEQNPFDILNSSVTALKDAIEKCGSFEIISIGITNQRETAILWNGKSGKPVYNAIVWQCRRTAETCRKLSGLGKEIKEKTGLFLDPYFSATKIGWIFDNVDGVRAMAEKGELLFGTVDSWILWNLTGGKAHATDASNASRTLLFNINSMEYDRELLDIFKVPDSILPEVLDSDAQFGLTLKEITGYPIPVVGILGDQQASLFAHAGFERGVIKNTYGTGLFVMAETGPAIYNPERLIATVAWKARGQTVYALEGSIFTGGDAIRFIKNNFGFLDSVSESSDIAKSLNSCEGVYFVPALSGLGAPYWAPNARGIITGLTAAADGRHIVRAALESMAYGTRDVIEEFARSTKGFVDKRSSVLRVDGKASENEFLMQFQADMLGMPLQKASFTEMTAFGIAGLSATATGFWTDGEFRGFRRIEKTYNPSMPAAVCDELYLGWNKAVAGLLGLS